MCLNDNNMSENSCSPRLTELHLAMLLQGPALRVARYCLARCYTSDISPWEFVKKHEMWWELRPEEVAELQNGKLPDEFSLPLVYRILKFCCWDTLVDRFSKRWDETIEDRMDLSSLEAALTTLYIRNEQFTRTGKGSVSETEKAIIGVVDMIGQQLAIEGCEEEQQAIRQSVAAILEENNRDEEFMKISLPGAMEIDCALTCHRVFAAAKVRRQELRDTREEWEEREEAALLQDMQMCLTKAVDTRSATSLSSFVYTNEGNVTEKNLIDEIMHQGAEQPQQRGKIICITGNRCVGKTSLAIKLASIFGDKSNTKEEASFFKYVALASGKEIQQNILNSIPTKSDQCHETSVLTNTFFPRSSEKYGSIEVENKILTEKSLMILDDVDEVKEDSLEIFNKLPSLLSCHSTCIIFGTRKSIHKVEELLEKCIPIEHYELEGVHQDCLFDIASNFIKKVERRKVSSTTKKSLKGALEKKMNIIQKKEFSSLKDSLKSNINRLANALRYPQNVLDTIDLWKSDKPSVNTSFNSSKLMWSLSVFKCNRALGIDLGMNLGMTKTYAQWFKLVGQIMLELHTKDTELNRKLYATLTEATESCFIADDANRLKEEFFKPRIFIDTLKHSSMVTTNDHTSKFFASYFVARELLVDETKCFKEFLPMHNIDEFACLVAGHVARWDKDTKSKELEEKPDHEVFKRIFASLLAFEELKNEDLIFFMKLTAELDCCHKLVQLVVNESDYLEEWELQLSNLQQKPLEIMLDHVNPVRIILKTDGADKNSELIPILKFMSMLSISIWFESRDQFVYGCEEVMDRIIRQFLNDKTRACIDLFTGSISKITTLDFADSRCTQQLVMLALRVTDEDELRTALNLTPHLKNLLWFELKIDMPIENIVLTSLPEIEVEMFDVYLRNLDDLCVPQITGLLTKLHKRYSGIHLNDTTLSPESVYTLLKELKQRKIALCATAESIDKYRRWYYPLLQNMPTKKLLTNKQVKKILGFEDRKFYSDHIIESSNFVKSIDAWNLNSYLEELTEIKYFEYKADNLSFVKNLDGQFETISHGSTKVDTTGFLT